MNHRRRMKEWPEFVTDDHQTPRRETAVGELTGWETVVFVLGDDQEEGSSAFSTAACAP